MVFCRKPTVALALLFFKVLADEYRTSQQLEKRRLQAIAMLESGKSYQTVANRLSASLSSVVSWVQSYRQEGRARLKAKPCFLIRLLRLVTHKNFCDLASMPLTCRGG